MADKRTGIMEMIAPPVRGDFSQASKLEWLYTNGTGAFAMGTVAGVNTRRYHGLLIASLNPPADRYSIFPRVEEAVEYEGTLFNLGAAQYPGVVSPDGYRLIEAFSHVPCPTWRYQCGSMMVEKSVHLLENEQTVSLSYRVSAACSFKLRPFISFRDYHSLTHQNAGLDTRIDEQPGLLTVRPYHDLPPLHIHHSGSHFESSAFWSLNNEYLRELDRGLDYREDLYSPGLIHFDLKAGQTISLYATLETNSSCVASIPTEARRPLTRALDQFKALRTDGRPTLIAGFPWFTDWSRDTLISLPAFLATGRDTSMVRSILEFLLAEREKGIVPNRFSDRSSSPEYNTVDATLWFFVAARAYVEQTRDVAFVKQTLLPAAMDIVEWHRRGTFYGIQVDSRDHLLASGEDGVQLTWMDAKVGSDVITPRTGKPVEIQSLWFNALRISSEWALMAGESDLNDQLLDEASKVQNSFNGKFWNADRGCLFDVLTPSHVDGRIRPNQLLAASLPFPLVDRARAKSIVDVVRDILLTPLGVRTLEPSDPQYRPRFSGDMVSRDTAYHQGTVWPWLIGPYVSAYMYAYEDSAEARQHCSEVVDSLVHELTTVCLGTLGEVYDADPPHHPGGCPAQLWSVAQVILALDRLGRF